MQPLLHFLLLAVAVTSVTVEVDLTVRCPLARWCWRSTFLELDIFYNDELNKPIWECSWEKSETRNYKGFQKGDGWFNNYLDLAFFIEHNCTSFGNDKIVIREFKTPQFASVSIKEEYAKFETEYKLLNRGEDALPSKTIEVYD